MIIAGIYGLIGGAALFIGALFGIYVKNVPKRVVGVIMAFGSGVLISALTFNLMEKAYQSGGFDSVSIGSVSYTHLRAHETRHDLVCRLLLEKKKKKKKKI